MCRVMKRGPQFAHKTTEHVDQLLGVDVHHQTLSQRVATVKRSLTPAEKTAGD